MPNFNGLLLKLKKKVESVDIAEPDMKSASGTFSTVNFVQRKITDTPAELAISKKKLDDAIHQDVPEIQKLLIERGVDMKFIQNYLYFDAEGKKISFRASEGSLYDYMSSHNKKLTRKNIKIIMGQLILGIQALHQKNLAHRDLKETNVLVTKNADGELFIQICDLDTIVPLESDGTIKQNIDFRLLGASHIPPDFSSLLTNTGSQWINNPQTLSAYKKANIKAADCYALGMILRNLIEYAVPGEFTQQEKNSLLLLSLSRTLPQNRSTIETVCDHPFFGETKEQREEFFNHLRNYESPYEFIGSHRARAFDANNNFLLIREDLKEIVSLTENLSSQFHYFDVLEEKMLEKIPLEMLKASLESLEKTLTVLNDRIDCSVIPELYDELEPLQEAANEKYAEIKKRFKIELKDYKKEFEAILDAFEKANITEEPVREILSAIRNSTRLHKLPEQNLRLLSELAYFMLLAIKYPTYTACSERFVEITLKLPTLFPELCQKMLTFSAVRLFTNKQLAIVKELRPALLEMGYQFNKKT